MYKKYEEIIKRLGITTAEVSRMTGIPEPVFSNWKNRGGCPRAENLVKIARCLGVTVEELFEE